MTTSITSVKEGALILLAVAIHKKVIDQKTALDIYRATDDVAGEVGGVQEDLIGTIADIMFDMHEQLKKEGRK